MNNLFTQSIAEIQFSTGTLIYGEICIGAEVYRPQPIYLYDRVKAPKAGHEHKADLNKYSCTFFKCTAY